MMKWTAGWPGKDGMDRWMDAGVTLEGIGYSVSLRLSLVLMLHYII